VAVVSGRQREDVEKLVGMKGIFYAGSHGFDIVGPGFTMIHPEAKKTIPVVERVIKRLTEEIGKISGVIIEQKKFSVAAHYRLVAGKDLPGVKKAVDDVIKKNDSLRLLSGKMVYEILPNIDWDKGKAIRWIMDALKISWDGSSVVYIGDDTTDEYAFRALRTRGTAILVAESPKESTADFGCLAPMR
ncbi:MAG: trehalose-phosphatase, partial [Candidatus Omnitrophota bacterium]